MRRIAVTAAAVAAAVALAGCGGGTSNTAPTSTTSVAAPTSAVADGEHNNSADVTFAQGMIPHHEQAIEMAKLAATRAESPEVKAFASQIQAAQDPEINEMKAWLSSWGEPTTMPNDMSHGGHMSGPMSSDDMAKLEGLSGSAFDREFLTMMTAHHQGAIEMAKTEQANGRYKPAKAMAADIIRAQSEEITKMTELLKSIQ
jgi:uncharacterized protein (DUF305 family)